MSPVTRANAVLTLLALVLGLALWWDLERQEAHYPPLTPLHPDQIHQVFIERAGELVEHLRRTATGWRSLRGPVEDQQWLNHLLHIAELPSLQRFPAPDDLAPFGLAEPAHRLRFNDIWIAWGGLEPVSGRRYVKVADQIHLVSDGYTHHIHPAPPCPSCPK